MDVEKISSPCCQLCGAKEATVEVSESQICSPCSSLIEVLKKNPVLAKKVLPQSHNTPKASDPELADVLDGKRYRTIDRDHNKWYLSVSEVDGHPVEVFASTAFDRDHELQSRISNLTTITRLISLILRHIFLGEKITLEKCLKQIQRSSRNKNDLPDMLYRVLSRYNKTT